MLFQWQPWLPWLCWSNDRVHKGLVGNVWDMSLTRKNVLKPANIQTFLFLFWVSNMSGRSHQISVIIYDIFVSKFQKYYLLVKFMEEYFISFVWICNCKFRFCKVTTNINSKMKILMRCQQKKNMTMQLSPPPPPWAPLIPHKMNVFIFVTFHLIIIFSGKPHKPWCEKHKNGWQCLPKDSFFGQMLGLTVSPIQTCREGGGKRKSLPKHSQIIPTNTECKSPPLPFECIPSSSLSYKSEFHF